MIPELRKKLNASFTQEKYQRLLQLLDQAAGTKIEFRPCETPVFLPKDLLIEMEQAGHELIAQLCKPDYLTASSRAVPVDFNTPNEGTHPHFIQVDFAITREADGRFAPKLIELQGCASLYAFQYLLPHEYRRVYELGELNYLLNGLTDDGYLELLRRVFLNDHDHEHVVLMEIDPLHQKTLPDFKLTESLFGIPFVNVSEIVKHGNKLFYQRNGREVEIRRIYNRVIIDEFMRKETTANFDFRDELDVEWAGHPNWYFRMSKFSLPFLDHPTVPRAWFLNQLDSVPDDLENFVLKPLFSFAGSGVKVNITTEDLEAVPVDERGDFLLQEKVAYAPVVETPDEPSKVEVRVMFIWPDAVAEPIAATTLARLSKGAMMGVDFNKNKSWVGSSCSFFEA